MIDEDLAAIVTDFILFSLKIQALVYLQKSKSNKYPIKTEAGCRDLYAEIQYPPPQEAHDVPSHWKSKTVSSKRPNLPHPTAYPSQQPQGRF